MWSLWKQTRTVHAWYKPATLGLCLSFSLHHSRALLFPKHPASRAHTGVPSRSHRSAIKLFLQLSWPYVLKQGNHWTLSFPIGYTDWPVSRRGLSISTSYIYALFMAAEYWETSHFFYQRKHLLRLHFVLFHQFPIRDKNLPGRRGVKHFQINVFSAECIVSAVLKGLGLGHQYTWLKREEKGKAIYKLVLNFSSTALLRPQEQVATLGEHLANWLSAETVKRLGACCSQGLGGYPHTALFPSQKAIWTPFKLLYAGVSLWYMYMFLWLCSHVPEGQRNLTPYIICVCVHFLHV